MKVLFDTSVLVAAMVEPHPRHAPAFAWLQRGHRAEVEFIASTHTVAELFAVLSILPVRPRIAPATARRLIEDNLYSHARIVALTKADYRRVISRTADLGIAGGGIYDALIARVAEKSEVDRLLTLNPKDFLRVWPQGRERVYSP